MYVLVSSRIWVPALGGWLYLNPKLQKIHPVADPIFYYLDPYWYWAASVIHTLFVTNEKKLVARTGTRTQDPQIKSLMLYRLSYPGSWWSRRVYIIIKCYNNSSKPFPLHVRDEWSDRIQGVLGADWSREIPSIIWTKQHQKNVFEIPPRWLWQASVHHEGTAISIHCTKSFVVRCCTCVVCAISLSCCGTANSDSLSSLVYTRLSWILELLIHWWAGVFSHDFPYAH